MPMLPVTHGNDFTRLQILLYTVPLVVTLLPTATAWWRMYLGGAMRARSGFPYAVRLYRDDDDRMPMRAPSVIPSST